MKAKCLAAVVFMAVGGASQAAVFTVTTNADAGVGSLRWAIMQANFLAGRDFIVFQIPPTNSPATIHLMNALPTINDPVVIDGWSQIGGPMCQAGIELDGFLAGAASGLTLSTTNCEIHGLCINRFQSHGVLIQGGGGHLISGCFIGTDIAGVTGLGNGGDGIQIDSSSDNHIGDLPTYSCTNRNVIAASGGCGIRLCATLGVGGCTRNWIQNNHIGTDAAGDVALANGGDGVRLEGGVVAQNYVGSTAAPKPVNVISANASNGVYIADGNGNYVQGNHIGVGRFGEDALGNGGNGVYLTNAPTCVIGESGGEGRNVIAANAGHGVEIAGPLAAGNNVYGNYIGVASNGMAALPNGGDGVRLTSECTQNRVGSESSDLARNLISGNAGCGVHITEVAFGNWVFNDIIGLNAAGLDGLGNQQHGVRISRGAYANYIGSSMFTNSGNVIAGNGTSNIHHGVMLDNGADDNEVARNLIGLNVNNDVRGNAGDGVRVESAGSNTIGSGQPEAGNVISGNGRSGIQLGPGARQTIVVGNLIGLDTNGLAARPNGGDGVLIYQASDNEIGRTGAARNVISGNLKSGVAIADNDLAHGNVVVNNYIGTDVFGAAPVGNNDHGVHIMNAPSNRIGGVLAEGNVISGNGQDGVCLEGAGASANTVAGNQIGVDTTGMAPLGNGRHGISVMGGSLNELGTPMLSGNVVGWNTNDGVHIEGPSARDNRVAANSIGADWFFGAMALPNGGHGVFIAGGASGTRVGGFGLGVQNVIRNNGGAGVRIDGGSNHAVRANSLADNGGLGVDLGPAGVTPNDVQDPDLGPNFLQNMPVLYEATTGSVVVAGLLNSLPSTMYEIQYYACGATPDPSGFGEGYIYLDSLSVTTGPDGNIVFEHTLPVSLSPGDFITATATDPWGNTSEFAQNVAVVPNELYGDADHDGMPTRWELPNHLDPYDPTGTNGPAGDPDGDDVSNWEEYVADTAPSDAGSYFHFVAIAESNEALVTYSSTNTRYYMVDWSSNLTEGSGWVSLYPWSIPGSNGVTTASDPVGPTARVYRATVRLVP